MVVCVRCLVDLVGNTGVEDIFDVLLDEPHHVTVADLCRVTLGVARDGLDAQLIDVAGGHGGEQYPIPKLRQEGEPEGVILVHV